MNSTSPVSETSSSSTRNQHPNVKEEMDADSVVKVIKVEDQEELVQLAVPPPEPAIEPPVVSSTVDELPLCVGSNGQDDSTRDSVTAHQPEPLPTATSASVSTDHQPAAPSRVSPPPHSASRNRNRCPVCSKSFPSQAHLRIHNRVHTGERPFRCTWPGCTKAFSTKGYLTVHTRGHTGDRPYRCTRPGCTKAFTTKTNRKIHLNTHTGARPHRCPQCPSAFTNRSALTTHLRLHTDQLPFQCGLCSKRFNMKQQLTRHMRSRKHRDHPQISSNRPPADSTVPQSTATSTTAHHPPPVQVKTEVEDQIKTEPSWSEDTKPPLPLHCIKHELVEEEEEEECKCSECLANLDSPSTPH